ncbi:MAG: hypothetical protein ACO1OD_09205 [Croceibacterium sp.]
MSAATEKPPVARTTGGQPKVVGTNGAQPFAHSDGADKAVEALSGHKGGIPGEAAYRAPTGRIWRYRGKRGRVLALLATMRHGVTQWDTLPWHTRLGGTIHALRRDGLAITTEIEGRYRHARYRLATPGCLLIQPDNREAAA